MNRAEFERLLSDWLDEPLRADLFALIERAGKQSPELAALRDQWRRVHALTRDDPKPLASVDWATRPAAIRAAIDADIEKAMQRGELDSVLALGGRSLNAVDWKGQRERIGAAIEAAVHDELRPGRLDEVLAAAASPAVDWQEQQVAVRRTLAARRRLRIFGFAAGITAAAAAIGLFMIRPGFFAPTPSGTSATIVALVASVELQPAESAEQTAEEPSWLEIAAPEDDGGDYVAMNTPEPGSDELYFSIEPARTTATP